MKNRLHEVRTCVAGGFRVLFPDTFTRKPRDFLDAYKNDPTARILQWDPFQNKLAEHYFLHISPNRDKTAIYQTRSAFDSCNREALLKFYGIFDHKHGEENSNPSPNSKVFERLRVGDLDGETMRPYGFSTNDFTRFQLRSFIPVLIWAYNEVKRCLLPEQQRFDALSRSLTRHLRYLNKLEGKPELILSLDPPDDGTPRLDRGVALEVRKSQYCKEYLGIATGKAQEGGWGEMKGEIMARTSDDGSSSNHDVEMGQGDGQEDITIRDAVASIDISMKKRKRVTFDLIDEEDASRSARKPWLGADSSGLSCKCYQFRPSASNEVFICSTTGSCPKCNNHAFETQVFSAKTGCR